MGVPGGRGGAAHAIESDVIGGLGRRPQGTGPPAPPNAPRSKSSSPQAGPSRNESGPDLCTFQACPPAKPALWFQNAPIIRRTRAYQPLPPPPRARHLARLGG